MSKNRKSLSLEVAKRIGCTPNKYGRYRLSDEQMRMLEKISAESVGSETKPNEYKKVLGKNVIMSAISDNGKMMDINEYCKHWGLPRNDISSYKLVSHTGTPFYNIVFLEKKIQENVQSWDWDAIINNVINSTEVEPRPYPQKMGNPSHNVVRVIYTDTHIGMDTNKNGVAMYPEKWDKKSLYDVCDKIIQRSIEEGKKTNSTEIILDDLGDLLDGWNAKTVRGGHELPQNMSNREAAEAAIGFKMRRLNGVSSYFSDITFNNITNDNHSGDFGGIVNDCFKNIVSRTHPHVKVVNHDKFINHYIVGSHGFVISHGKDSKHLKFGFKPHLDEKQIGHIDAYIKDAGLYRLCKYIEFSKGDSHQCLFNYSGSDDFDYMNYGALSPSSEWIQTNYKKGRQSFSVQSFNKYDKNKITYPVFI